MFAKVLIANRGEIACRIARTCRRLGIATVAVYSDADAESAHVAAADEAHRIGPAPASESYLVADRLIEVARRSGAEAVHPGYGFLSENAAFAEACAAAGLVFVGPPPDAIRLMGGKSEAKARMAEAGVPLVPGYHGEAQDADTLAEEATRIGYPLLIKASAGGGGKGMRVVESADGFGAALDGARREAAGAFGDDRVLLEKYLARPRHVEVQVMADAHGRVVHLFERDCSIQRRHQKVVEEAPAPGLEPATRARMGAAAVAAAEAIGYVGAGTVEFLLDTDGSFYFMEMNTRLQVEHPVTEMITGRDLVAWQLDVAAGAPLGVAQDDLSIDGHAIEVRLYAEDPAAGFLPQTGRLDRLSLPGADGTDPHVRLDSGVREGDSVTPHYDPMIAKLIVWDRDRPSAVRRLGRALDSCRIAGVTTNLPLLGAIAAHPAFGAGDLDTRFLERHAADVLPDRAPASDDALAVAALGVLLDRRRGARVRAAASGDPHSPWHDAGGWRLNDEARETLAFRDPDADGALRELVVRYPRRGGYRLALPGGGIVHADGTLDGDGRMVAEMDGVRTAGSYSRRGLDLTVILPRAARGGGVHRLSLVDVVAEAESYADPGSLTAPMPGRVVAVLVGEGDSVAKGTALMVLEAMKMEHTVTAPRDGVVARLPFAAGDTVAEGVELVGFEAA
ncbi:MAG: acetyl/propionyl/methylcrotonyl-CoA carboxylase subunit alpha [Azospirillaceae bacterium]